MEKKPMNFEEKLEKLESIVKELENGDTPLDKAIEKYNEAMILAKDCNKTLEDATETINKVVDKEGKESILDPLNKE